MENPKLIKRLAEKLGPSRLITGHNQSKHFRQGWRSGEGDALAVIFPDTLLDCWHCLQICIDENAIIIMQGANTGLTEGSTPSGVDYDRPIVIINTLAMNKLFTLGNAEQVISFAGATLNQLEKTLTAYNRTPHSVIGSSCLGASVIGGIANNSGGALVKRGPAYTELALYAQLDEQRNLKLVNHLDIELGNDPETILTNLENGEFDMSVTVSDKCASAQDYEATLRDIDADSPSRFNADPKRLYEASGCAGKLAVFAVRLDTFKKPQKEQTFYIGTNDATVLTKLRRHILSEFEHLPDIGEYLHRDMFNIAKTYGKDLYLSVKKLGTNKLPYLFKLKNKIDGLLNNIGLFPANTTDKFFQFCSRLLPTHLPKRLIEMNQNYEHHLILKMTDDGITEAQRFLTEFMTEHHATSHYLICDQKETDAAYLHRFVAAGAATRYQQIHTKEVGEILALDIALKRNEHNWVENLPEHITSRLEQRLYYGHFFCHVFHQDYILKKGVNPERLKADILKLLDEKGAKYPAEHNVGHLYEAEQTLKDFYRSLDPTNTFNPGIGKTSKHSRNCGC